MIQLTCLQAEKLLGYQFVTIAGELRCKACGARVCSDDVARDINNHSAGCCFGQLMDLFRLEMLYGTET